MKRMVKKTVKLNQYYIDRLRTIFGLKTDNEAVNKALELAIIDDEMIRAHDGEAGKGDILDEVIEVEHV